MAGVVQAPIQLQDAQLDEVTSKLRKYLVDPVTRERIGRARFLGGWEVWLQVDLVLFLQREYPNHDITREKKIFPNLHESVDVWAQPGPFAPNAAGLPRFAIELKVEYDTAGRTLRSRLEQEITQLRNGARVPQPAYSTPGTLFYCVGFTQMLDDCTKGWENLSRQYPGLQMYWWKLPGMGVTADMGGAANYYLVWYKHTF